MELWNSGIQIVITELLESKALYYGMYFGFYYGIYYGIHCLMHHVICYRVLEVQVYYSTM